MRQTQLAEMAAMPWMIGIAAVVLLGVAGCSDSDEATSPWAEEILLAQGEATSDFERKVFEDLEITKGEYDEAFQLMYDCAEEKGASLGVDVELKTDEQGFHSLLAAHSVEADITTEQVDEIYNVCELGTTYLIDFIYRGVVTYPDGQPEPDWDVWLQCLKDRGGVPAELTLEQLRGHLSELDIEPEVIEACNIEAAVR